MSFYDGKILVSISILLFFLSLNSQSHRKFKIQYLIFNYLFLIVLSFIGLAPFKNAGGLHSDYLRFKL